MSLNKAFYKIPRSAFETGKGSYWAVDETYIKENASDTSNSQSATRTNSPNEPAPTERPPPRSTQTAMSSDLLPNYEPQTHLLPVKLIFSAPNGSSVVNQKDPLLFAHDWNSNIKNNDPCMTPEHRILPPCNAILSNVPQYS